MRLGLRLGLRIVLRVWKILRGKNDYFIRISDSLSDSDGDSLSDSLSDSDGASDAIPATPAPLLTITIITISFRDYNFLS